jgi:NADH dehydrogenase FAD-containing subunit
VKTHVVILGAGFGGLELSSRLSAEAAKEKRQYAADRRDRWFRPGDSRTAIRGKS